MSRKDQKVVGLQRKIAELERKLAESKTRISELSRLAYRDALTGLWNFRKLQFDYAQTRQNSLGVIFIDVDRLKWINDNLSYEKGNIALKKVVHLLKMEVRESDPIYRFGGDEFVIFLPGGGKKEAEKLVKRLKRKEVFLDGNPVTFSIGIWEWEKGLSLDELLLAASEEMKKQKKK